MRAWGSELRLRASTSPWWVALLVVALLLRVVGFTRLPDDLHEQRQVYTLTLARSYEWGAPLLSPWGNWFGAHPRPALVELPLFSILAHLAGSLFGLLAGARLVTLAAGVLAVAAFHAINVRRHHPRPRLATVLFALAPGTIFFSHSVQPDGFLLALALGSGYAALRSEDGWGWMAAGAGLFALAAGVKPTSLLFVGPPLVGLALIGRRRLRPLVILGAGIAGWLAWSAWAHAVDLAQSPDWYADNFGLQRLIGEAALRLDPAAWLQFLVKYPYLLLGPLLGAMLLAAAARRRGDKFWWAWLAGGTVAFLIFTPLFRDHVYYSLPLVAPAAAIAAAYTPPWPQAFLARLALVAGVLLSTAAPLASEFHEDPIYVDAGRALARHSTRAETVLVLSLSGRMQFFPDVLFFADRNGWSLPEGASSAAISHLAPPPACALVMVFDSPGLARRDPPAGWVTAERGGDYLVARRLGAGC